MAENVLFNIAGRIINSLAGPLVTKEFTLIWGAKGELEKFKSTVSAIKAVLLHAEELQGGNPAVNDWLEKLNDIIYDADDLLDVVSTEALRRKIMTKNKKAKEVRIFFSKSNQLAFSLKMGHKIKAISERLYAIKDIKGFQLEPRLVERQMSSTERVSTHSFVLAEEVIGREDDKVEVIKRLTDVSMKENVSILPIFGIGGVGKTTLAQYVFNDKTIQKHFELKIWVCVSDNFDVKNIIKKILESATRKKSKLDEMNSLVTDLKEKIDTKKYLLVLDDVWNEDINKWSMLEQVLIGGAKGSRILVTTRSEKVGKIISPKEPYYLKGLGEHASWDLFKHAASLDMEWPENSITQKMKREIVRKFVGSPLALKTVGRLLHFKSLEIDWLSFLEKELSNISQGEYGIIPTLKFSYNKLPSQLKHCFAYCSLFPKDHIFDKTTIVNHWIAHGFVERSSSNQCLEDIGNDYFMNLLWRLFFQDPQVDDLHRLSECKMHHHMHDLATLVAGSLVTIFDGSERKTNEKARHLSISGDLGFSFKELISLYEGRMIRTFLCPKFKGEIDCEAIFLRFKFLRVLNLSDNNLKSLPNIIGKLKHLRYLDLSYNRQIKVLPDSFTDLLNLQFLKLQRCVSLMELPRGFKKLVNLRYFDINDCLKLKNLPCGFEQLTNLQFLRIFPLDPFSSYKDSAKLSELRGLDKLKGALGIFRLRHSKSIASEYKEANIKGKHGLQVLDLHFSPLQEAHDFDVEDETMLEGLQPHPNLKQLSLHFYRSPRLPSWVLSITSLVRLSLHFGKCKCLPPVNQLPLLKQLRLSAMKHMDYISDDTNKFSSSSAPEDFFPSLESIELDFCFILKGWWRDFSLELDRDSDNYVEKTAATSMVEYHSLPSFPKLSSLVIRTCPMLTSLPLFPRVEELYLEFSNWKLLQESMMMKTSSLSPLFSELKVLELESVSELEILREEWLEKLRSLESLKILRCSDLKSFSYGNQHLTALKHLVLDNCPELELADHEHGMCWKGLKNLLSLKVSALSKLVSLPLGLQHISTIRNLEISNCENLITILESIHSWNSLEVLRISKCRSLELLPEGLHSLSYLRLLKVARCPILLPRCEKDIGADWPKIAHIPDLHLE